MRVGSRWGRGRIESVYDRAGYRRGISGRLEGNVLYGFSDGTALAVASHMMGEPVTELDDIGLSALGEIANMITGNAATQLAATGYTCDISPPVIIEPAESRFYTPGGKQILVTFGSKLCNLNVRISLNESTRNK